MSKKYLGKIKRRPVRKKGRIKVKVHPKNQIFTGSMRGGRRL